MAGRTAYKFECVRYVFFAKVLLCFGHFGWRLNSQFGVTLRVFESSGVLGSVVARAPRPVSDSVPKWDVRGTVPRLRAPCSGVSKTCPESVLRVL